MVVLPVLSIATYGAAVVGHHPNINGPDALEKFSGFLRIAAVILLLLGFVIGLTNFNTGTLGMSVGALIVIGLLATYDYMIVAKKARANAKESVAKAGKEYLETKKEIEKGPDQVTNVQGDAVSQKTQRTHVDQSTTNVDTIDQSQTSIDQSQTSIDQSQTSVDQSRTVNDQRTQVEDSVVNRSDISASDETVAPRDSQSQQRATQQQPQQSSQQPQQSSQQPQQSSQQPRQQQPSRQQPSEQQPPREQQAGTQPSQNRPRQEREVEANPRERGGQPTEQGDTPSGQSRAGGHDQPSTESGGGGGGEADYCPSCGEEITPGWSNCISCGAEL
jgi:hypothetical protein